MTLSVDFTNHSADIAPLISILVYHHQRNLQRKREKS